jgi:hypothetical protein
MGGDHFVATRVSTGLEHAGYPASRGRRFGLSVGSAFLVIGALLSWRGAGTAALVAAALGGALVLSGLVAPTRLQRVEAGWMRFAFALSRVTTPIVLAAIFFLVITPIGLLARQFGHQPLRRPTGATFWLTRPTGRSDLRRQF